MTSPGPPRLVIYLIRHGETPWSISGQHTGSTDIALTGHGENEARALRPWLRDVAFARVLTSPRQRARRTAALAAPSATASVEPDLAEWDYGQYEGMRSAIIRQQRPGWSVFRDGCPGGESPQQASRRADALIARLRASQGNVALFSHGQFACVLGARWIGLPIAEAAHLSLATASLSILGSSANHPELPVIALWNAVPAMLPDAPRSSELAIPASPQTVRRRIDRSRPDHVSRPAVRAVRADITNHLPQ